MSDRILALLKKGADPNRGLLSAADCGHPSMVKFFLENGANLHSNNQAAFKAAATSGRTNTVKELIKLGADPSKISIVIRPHPFDGTDLYYIQMLPDQTVFMFLIFLVNMISSLIY
jgi:ankyrin repeat protein